MPSQDQTCCMPSFETVHLLLNSSATLGLGGITCVRAQHVRILVIVVTPARVLMCLPLILVQLAAQPTPTFSCLHTCHMHSWHRPTQQYAHQVLTTSSNNLTAHNFRAQVDCPLLHPINLNIATVLMLGVPDDYDRPSSDRV